MARSTYAGEIEAPVREDGLSRLSTEYRTKKSPVEAPVDGRSPCEGETLAMKHLLSQPQVMSAVYKQRQTGEL